MISVILNFLYSSCTCLQLTIQRRKANWIGHVLHRNCLLTHVIEGEIKGRMEVTEGRGRRPKQLLDGRQEKRGYYKLKE
jgi:hypothetical protein